MTPYIHTNKKELAIKLTILFLGMTESLFIIIENKASKTIIKNVRYSIREASPIEKKIPIDKEKRTINSNILNRFIVNSAYLLYFKFCI